MNASNSPNVDIGLSTAKPSSQAELPLPHGWYPVAQSRALKPGQKQGLRFLGQDWLLFRTQTGQLGVVARHCSHMGADLNQGQVDDECIRCPLHGWRFDPRGHCHKRLQQPFKQQAQLPSLATAEYAGMVFVFTAAQATYPLPELPFEPNCAFSSTQKLTLPIHFLLASMNSFDVAHYAYVHHRRINQTPKIYSHNPQHLGIELHATVIRKNWQDKLMYGLGFKAMDIRIDVWGTSLLQMYNHQANMGALIAVMPLDKQHSEIYIAAYDSRPSKNPLTRPLQAIKREISRLITTAFLRSDVPIGQGLIPTQGVLIPGQDDEVKQFWSYYQQLPKTSVRYED